MWICNPSAAGMVHLQRCQKENLKVRQHAAGKGYRYYMVFRDSEMPIEGAYRMSDFLDVLKEL